MKNRGRPPLGPIQLKDGFYIEVCNKGVKKGVKIWSETQKSMMDAAAIYSSYKEVLILGEYTNGIPSMPSPRSYYTIK